MKLFVKRHFSTDSVLVIMLSMIYLCPFIESGCKKEQADKPALETGAVTDLEGNVYKTVKIGNQWWISENLRSRRFRNGSYLLNAVTNDQWNDTVPSYCVFPTANNSAPGFLYNFYAVSDTGNIAPAGWHVSTDDDWKELEKFLGMSQDAADKAGWRGTTEAGKLKIESPKGWTTCNDIWSSNESGFSAVAGGSRLFKGTWGEPGVFATGFWWTSTNSVSGAYYRYMDYKNTTVFRSHCDMRYGFNIRCVKDN